MKVLVDTSVWIEFFKKKSVFSIEGLELLLEEGYVVTCLPVRSELLSGDINSNNLKIVKEAIDSLPFVDLDWANQGSWDLLVSFAKQAKEAKVACPGLIDRMILASALKSGVALWTFDQKLQKMARLFKITLY